MAEQARGIVTSGTGLWAERVGVQAREHAGLVAAQEAAAGAPPAQRRRASVRRAVAGLGFLGVVAAGGGAAIQAAATHDGEGAGASPLELTPAAPGFLRVLAAPWAEVWVDGQRIDVTPFARAIPLSPGVHYVTLVHPSAPVEKRTITGVRGETRTLDVVMALASGAPGDEAGAPALRAERTR